jgi:arylsulfatase A-like enzyme
MAMGLASGALAATPAGAAQVTDRYDACIHDVDEALGVLFDGLEERAAWSSTIVVVTADHGDELLDRGQAGHAWWTYRGGLHEEILHVPLFLWAPAVAPRAIDALVEQVDVAPTLLALAGVEPPASAPSLEGRSLVPLLEGRTLPRRPAFAESTPAGFYAEPEIMGDVRVRSVIDGPWKLIVSQGLLGVRRQLFRLDHDPREAVDLAAREPAQVKRLTGLLADWLLDERRRSFELRRATLRPGAEVPLESVLGSPEWLEP